MHVIDMFYTIIDDTPIDNNLILYLFLVYRTLSYNPDQHYFLSLLFFYR